MRTTVRLRDEILRKARERAAAEGRTLTSLIEEGLLRVLDQPRPARSRKVSLPVSRARGGLQPGVDLARSAELEDLMNSR
ncbi:MAG: hypothetical protein J0M16_01290 [Gammaproteobacteria bacterium]|nr:hypothetical protein [Gammaproteobacteria bacterium]